MSNIDKRKQRAADDWSLSIGDDMTGGTSSDVFAAIDKASRDLVLKLPDTQAGRPDATANEAAALKAWAGTGAAVTLLDATDDALLLLRARPGAAWPWTPQQPMDDAIAVAAELLRRLWAAPPPPYHFPTLSEVYPDDERVAREDAAAEQAAHDDPDRGRPGLDRLAAAGAAAQNLISTTIEPKLLHGDFISKNLISDSTRPTGWVALDPLPMIGDPAAEAGAFAAYHPAGLILPIAEKLARQIGIDVHRVLQWAAIRAVHQAAQAWRDDQQELDQLVVSTPIDDLLTT